jgi:iron complex transport system ATP-binding protein
LMADCLVARQVGVRLGNRDVLSDVSFALPKGALVALVGPNGAGKTTLLRALAGLLPFAGSVRNGADDVAALTIHQRAQRFAYLPQGHVVHWRLPARDIVALGRYPHGATDPAWLSPDDEAAVARAIAATETEAFADRPVTELSGGERSRVALARVLAVEAPIIFADEPIASLDPRYQLDVMRLLRRAADGGTLVVVVTHDLGLATRFADTVLVLSEGKLAAQGAPAQALTAEVLARVFRVGVFRAQHEGASVLVPWSGV